MSKTGLAYDDLVDEERRKLDTGVLYDTTLLMKHHEIKSVVFEKEIGEYVAKVEVREGSNTY